MKKEPSSSTGAAPSTSSSSAPCRDVYDIASAQMPSTSQRALEAPSDPEDEATAGGGPAYFGQPATVEAAWRGDGDSDADSVDSDMEDPLK